MAKQVRRRRSDKLKLTPLHLGLIGGAAVLVVVVVVAIVVSGSGDKGMSGEQLANMRWVYVTGDGDLYHSESCSQLEGGKMRISIENAVSQGHAGCPECGVGAPG